MCSLYLEPAIARTVVVESPACIIQSSVVIYSYVPFEHLVQAGIVIGNALILSIEKRSVVDAADGKFKL